MREPISLPDLARLIPRHEVSLRRDVYAGRLRTIQFAPRGRHHVAFSDALNLVSRSYGVDADEAAQIIDAKLNESRGVS